MGQREGPAMQSYYSLLCQAFLSPGAGHYSPESRVLGATGGASEEKILEHGVSQAPTLS